MSKNKSKDLQSIQMLRGLAATWVVLHHCNIYFGFAEGSLLWQIGHYGNMGVNMFFIISGFIIPFSMAKYNYGYGDFKDFMMKRVTRIEPPYIASIVLALLLLFVNTLSPWYKGEAFAINWPNTLGHLAYLNAFTGAPWLNAAYWTLAIEFEFYLLMSLIFPMLVSGRKSVMWTTLLMLMASALLPNNFAHIFYHIPFFVLGMCLFLYTVERISLRAALLSMAATILVMASYADTSFLVLSVGTLLAIQFIGKVPRPLLFIGTISYSLYLVHGFIIGRFFALAGKFFPGANTLVVNLLCLACIFTGAWLFYLAVEKPFQKLSKKIGEPKQQPAEPQLMPAAAVEEPQR